jgi:hypothetical protein
VLLREVTVELVVRLFFGSTAERQLRQQSCVRYQLPGLCAVNFVLTNVLGGGGGSSLKYDRQAKTFAQRLLQVVVHCPAALLPPVSVSAKL